MRGLSEYLKRALKSWITGELACHRALSKERKRIIYAQTNKK
jgi:hypothetical protein